METKKPEVVIPSNIIPPPEEHEVSAAWILAKEYNCAITFLPKREGYMLKTPDFVMKGLEWELKSPTGNAKRTIRNNIDIAKAQAASIIIDTRRTALADDWVENELKRQCSIKKRIARLIMIKKNEKIVVIRWK